MFLCETKLTPMQISNASRKLRIESCLVVNKNGMGSGLALVWNNNVNVSITSYSSHHIDAMVQNGNRSWMRFMGIYGHLEMGQKKHMDNTEKISRFV